MISKNRTSAFPASSQAFTLVEMLVVIAIVALLVAVLLPSLAQGKLAARTALCFANERQQHLAFALYANDFRDVIPPVGTTYNYMAGSRGAAWYHYLGKTGGYMTDRTEVFAGKVFGYGGSRNKVFKCAAESGSRKAGMEGITYFDSELADSSYVMYWQVSAYHYYEGYMDQYYPMWQYFRRGFSKGGDNNIAPGNTYFVMDGPDWGVSWLLPYFVWDIDNPARFDGFYDYSFRHLGKSTNMLFLDGHAAPAKHVNDTGKPLWQTVWKRCPNWYWMTCDNGCIYAGGSWGL